MFCLTLFKKISELFCPSAKIQPKADSWHRKNIKFKICGFVQLAQFLPPPPFFSDSNGFHCWMILLKEGGVSPIYNVIMLSLLLSDKMPAACSLVRKIVKNMVILLNWTFTFICSATCRFRSI